MNTMIKTGQSVLVLGFTLLAWASCEGPLNPKACENHPNPDQWCGAGMFCYRNAEGSICRPLRDAGSDTTGGGGAGGKGDANAGGTGGAGLDGSGLGESPGTGGWVSGLDSSVAMDMPDASTSLDAPVDQLPLPTDVPNPPDVPICTSGGGELCPQEGAKRCSGAGEQGCQRSDSCLRWSAVVQCSAGQSCSGTSPNAGCSCPSGGCAAEGEGARRCSDGSVQVCSKNGVCLAWVNEAKCLLPKVCPVGKTACECPADTCGPQCIRCGIDQSCINGSCQITCGDAGTRCCVSGSDCRSGLRCNSSNLCETCGEAGGQCCASRVCNTGLVCRPDTNLCGTCGQPGLPCCPGATPCTAGSCNTANGFCVL